MFDSPVADHMPGKLAYMGFPYHGLLLFPGQQNSTSCPIGDVRLITHSGRQIRPFLGINKSVSRHAIAHGARLFADPRAVDVPEDPHVGEDHSGYLVLTEQADWAGIGGMAVGFPYNGIYHDGADNHLINTSTGRMRIVDRIEVSRDWRLEISDRFVDVPLSPGTIVDSSPDGATIVCYRYDWDNPASLYAISLSGVWPEVQGSSASIVPFEDSDRSENTMVGTDSKDADYWEFSAFAFCSDDPEEGCSIILTDRAADGPSPWAFPLDWGYVHTRTRDKLLTAWLDQGQVGQLWFRHVDELTLTHDVEWGVDYREENQMRARVEYHNNHVDLSHSKVSWSMTNGDTTVSEVALERFHEYRQDTQTIVEALASGGHGDSGSAAQEETEFYLTLTFDGLDILSRFPEIVNPDLGGSSDYFNIEGAMMITGDAPDGERKALHFYIRPLQYSRELFALQCRCAYEHKVGSQRVEFRSEIIVGNGFARGVTDAGIFVHAGSTSDTLYGSSCPKTKKIARNYLYPVTWI